MTPGVEEFRRRLQTELGLTISPKDPILAEWLAHEELKEELAAEHQRMLVGFEEALRKNEALWIESAKNLANQSLNAALRAARESTAALIEEAGRSQGAAVRAALERGVERIEKAAVKLARLSWVTFAAAVIALVAATMLIAVRFLH
jgi:NADH dehydrogenase/NADH:ubiquinone oxidoreductase subunit G